ncbi:MAG: hypothetical protein EOO10_03795 [Chitinophagaceae bacterium]|nr:MAG: hypothetical protein EOO10_03795 [Chitinophagaceae bacterium]
MKYKKRFIICNLLAGLTALTYSCGKNKSPIELLVTKELNFPSASAIEFYHNKLFLFGDDATHLLVLSPNYQPTDSINYWQGSFHRIPKPVKPDIESSLLLEEGGETILYGIGSMSDVNRWKVIKHKLNSQQTDTFSYFISKNILAQINQLNIEGSATVNNTIVLANRANLSNPVNHLLYWDRADVHLISKQLLLPKQKTVAGVSGLYYVKEGDLLLLTASEEEAASTTKDGTIGESYLGGIKNFSKKLNDAEFKPDFFYQLSKADDRFSKQKIESVCLETIGDDELILHLAADNDNGKSHLFRIRLKQ